MINIFFLISSILSFQIFFFSPFIVDGPSMEPTFHAGDIIFVEQPALGNTYNRGEVIVFSFADNPDYYYVKRIIGLPGETVKIMNDGVYVGTILDSIMKLPENYLPPSVSSVPVGSLYKHDFQQTFNVPENKYFVLGDNRTHSLDSRYFKDPFVDYSEIKGSYISTLFGSDDELATSSIVIETSKGSASFDVELAETNDQRMKGLMFRNSLEHGNGMFFIFDDQVDLAFWMKNTLIALDMIFVDEDWKIVHIQKDAQPCKVSPCVNYSSGSPVKYVLEIGGGEADRLGIEDGDEVTLNR